MNALQNSFCCINVKMRGVMITAVRNVDQFLSLVIPVFLLLVFF
jgi:hypothetical protein